MCDEVKCEIQTNFSAQVNYLCALYLIIKTKCSYLLLHIKIPSNFSITITMTRNKNTNKPTLSNAIKKTCLS